MLATVVGINLDAQANGKNYVEFITQADPYNGQTKPPRTHKLYPAFKADLINVVKGLAVGDRVEYRVDDTQYKSMNYLAKVDAATAPTGGGQKKAGGWKQDDDVTKRIARAASMKEATQIVLFTAKKTDDPLDYWGS